MTCIINNDGSMSGRKLSGRQLPYSECIVYRNFVRTSSPSDYCGQWLRVYRTRSKVPILIMYQKISLGKTVSATASDESSSRFVPHIWCFPHFLNPNANYIIYAIIGEFRDGASTASAHACTDKTVNWRNHLRPVWPEWKESFGWTWSSITF